MDRLRGLFVRLRCLVFRNAVDQEMDEELRFHVEMETQRLTREGVDPSEARRRALIVFGGVERYRQDLRKGRRAPMIEPLFKDLRYGMRGLSRSPGFTLIAVITIALGVGATTSIFTILNGLFLRTLDVPAADQLFAIEETRSGEVAGGVEGAKMPYPRYESYRERTGDVFTHLAAFQLRRLSLREAAAAVPVEGGLVSGNYFEALGVIPSAGRFFGEDRAAEAVLSYGFWQGKFGGDPDVVGRTIFLDSRPFTVVGVGPADFVGTTRPLVTQVWVPHQAYYVSDLQGDGFAADWVGAFGRLRDGREQRAAQSRVDLVGKDIQPRKEFTTIHGVRLTSPAAGGAQGRAILSGFFGLLMALGLVVLIIASANIAALLLARGFRRTREMAIRLAVGAGSGRLIRQLLAETLLLFGLGGVLGAILAYGGARLLWAIPLPFALPLAVNLEPDLTVLGFALALALSTGLVFGLSPAINAAGADLVSGLKSGPASGGPQRGLGRSFFTTIQVAMSTFLLLVAVMIARSLSSGFEDELGFQPDGVVVASFDLSAHRYTEADGRRFYDELLSRVRGLPDVQEASISQFSPLAIGGLSSDAIAYDESGNRTDRYNAGLNTIDPTFFETLRIPLSEGRFFSTADAQGSEPVVVINDELAQQLWPGRNPLGQLLRWGGIDRTVVGLVPTSKYVFVAEQPRGYAFSPFLQNYQANMTLHALAPGKEAETIQAIRDIALALDANIAVQGAKPLSDIVQASAFPYRFAGLMVSIFGGLGLLLAALGLYGVLAFQVARRTREFGIRRALGAEGTVLVHNVLGAGVRLGATGCIIGLALGATATLLLKSVLLGVAPLDPVTFAVVPAVILIVSLFASYVPARRATAVPASEALRAE